MNITPLSQRDPKWKNIKLGFTTNTTIGSHGCTLTALCMLLNYLGYSETPATVNANLKRVNGFSDGKFTGKGNLLVWGAVQKVYPRVKHVKRVHSYHNLEVAFFVYGKQMPVLVQVNGAKIGASKHWILFKGQGKANDPWYGKEISTNYYPLTGYSLFEKVK